MADNLYGAGAQLLEGAAATAGDIQKQDIERTKTTVDAGKSAGSDLSAERSQMSSQQAAMALEKMKATDKLQGKIITLTPQVAMGLVKNTGDPGWMQAVGQDMRADVLLGMYTHGMAAANAKKSPKITQIYDGNGKIRHAVVYTDDAGNQQELMLDQGITPENLNKGKGIGKGSKGGADDADFKKNKEFMRAHEKQATLINDPIKSKQLQSTNSDQYNRMKEEYDKDQDRYDQLKTSMGDAGKAPAATPTAAASAAPGNSPFDADAFIKDALGNQ